MPHLMPQFDTTICNISSPIGELEITEQNFKLVKVQLVKAQLKMKSKIQQPNSAPPTPLWEILSPPRSELLKQAVLQFQEYFFENRKTFDLPLHLVGTDFQKKVWQTARQIPYGEVLTYKEVAAKINQPSAARAVGGALNKNPLLLIIPCHRVIAAHGLGGFAVGLTTKKYLLNLES